MITTGEPAVGRFSVDLVLTNQEDLTEAKKGHIAPSQVRRTTIRGFVDSGAAYLVIPASVAKTLGLEMNSTAKVRYADGRMAERPVARLVNLACAGRDGTFNAIVEPGRESALIGAIVLEDLVLIVDCNRQRLVPRDPDHIIAEIE